MAGTCDATRTTPIRRDFGNEDDDGRTVLVGAGELKKNTLMRCLEGFNTTEVLKAVKNTHLYTRMNCPVPVRSEIEIGLPSDRFLTKESKSSLRCFH